MSDWAAHWEQRSADQRVPHWAEQSVDSRVHLSVVQTANLKVEPKVHRWAELSADNSAMRWAGHWEIQRAAMKVTMRAEKKEQQWAAAMEHR